MEWCSQALKGTHAEEWDTRVAARDGWIAPLQTKVVIVTSFATSLMTAVRMFRRSVQHQRQGKSKASYSSSLSSMGPPVEELASLAAVRG